LEPDFISTVRDISTAAVHDAATALRRLLGTEVIVPSPTVNLLEASELRMALEQHAGQTTHSAICQGFVGSGIAGEALLTMRNLGAATAAALMNTEPPADGMETTELLLEVANILIGACLRGLAGQIEIAFTQSHPMMLAADWRQSSQQMQPAGSALPLLAIEMQLWFSDVKLQGEVLLVFTTDSVSILRRHLSYLQ
jgi:chemotaxis protein CheY-P-specific phosphatase CheC